MDARDRTASEWEVKAHRGLPVEEGLSPATPKPPHWAHELSSQGGTNGGNTWTLLLQDWSSWPHNLKSSQPPGAD